MKSKHIVTVLSAVILIVIFGVIHAVTNQKIERHIKIGYIYVGDASTAYTYNFIRAQEAIAQEYEGSVTNIPLYNIAEGDGTREAIDRLIDEGCDIIFSTSYGYGEYVKKAAMDHPEIQFCQATCSDANADPQLPNYHNFMGRIYEGRYISGVVAGMKLKELLDNKTITTDEALVGYVAAFPYAEVISGYTAFFLGVQSIVPEVKMNVRYTDTWNDYKIEKNCAEALIEEGCVIISQHSDTMGPAIACENAGKDKHVYHIGYNESMTDVAPTTSLISSRINWTPYMVGAVNAVLQNQKIETMIDGTVYGNDVCAGFDKDWVQMLDLNHVIAADGTDEEIARIITRFNNHSLQVFKGDFTGVDPFDETDTYNLNEAFIENKESSAPMFHYVLNDVIRVEE